MSSTFSGRLSIFPFREVAFGLALCVLFAVPPSPVGGQPAAASDLRLAAPIATWDEAIPLGNGLLGGLLWGGGADHRINLSLDRGDLWDLRAAAPFGSRCFTYCCKYR